MITVTTPVALVGAGLVLTVAAAGFVAYNITANPTTVAPAANTGNNGNGNANGNDKSNPGHPINLTGVVSGTIRPGAPATLSVNIENPNNQDINVTSVTGSITSVTTGTLPGRPACQSAWFHVGTFTGAKNIAKNKSGVVSVPISLDNLSVNQDNCKGVTVQFTFAAQAEQA